MRAHEGAIGTFDYIFLDFPAKSDFLLNYGFIYSLNTIFDLIQMQSSVIVSQMVNSILKTKSADAALKQHPEIVVKLTTSEKNNISGRNAPRCDKSGVPFGGAKSNLYTLATRKVELTLKVVVQIEKMAKQWPL